MKSLERFLTLISKIVRWDPLADQRAVEALSQLNPDKIYVENVRSLLGVSHRQAVQICETAVRQGVFVRGVEVLCPNKVVAASAPSEAELPPVVRCWVEQDGEEEQQEFKTETLPKLVFYRLVDDQADRLIRQTA